MSAGFLNPSAGLGGNMPGDPTGDLVARQKLAELLAGGKGHYSDTSPKQHPFQVLAQVADGAMEGLSARQQLTALLAQQQAGSSLFGKAMGGASGATIAPSSTGATSSGGATAASVSGQASAMPSGDGAAIQGRFTDALKTGGLTNPYGLAAMTAYAQHESRYSPKNISGSWSDPSERGQAGTSGGILSWRDDRLRNMQAATAGAKDPVTAQAQFALSEDPALTAALQNAKSPEEANALMADAWKFAGYNRPGRGEYADRLATTQAYASRFKGEGTAQPGAQAAADPKADLPVEGAEETGAPGTSLPTTRDGFAIPPAPDQAAASPDQAGAAPDDLRAQLQAMFDEQQARETATGAVMTMPGDAAGDQPQGAGLRAELVQAMAAQRGREASRGLGNATNGTELGADPRADMPAAGASPAAMNPMSDRDGTGAPSGDLPRTADGFAIPPGPDQAAAAPDDLRAQLQAAFDAKRAGGAGPDTAYTAFAGEPQPSDGDMPAAQAPGPTAPPMPQPGQLPHPDIAALMSPKPPGAPSVPSMVGAPTPDMPVAAPMTVPLPPQRPSDQALAASAQQAAEPAPRPAAVPTPAPAAPPQDSPRARLAQVLAQPRTDAPDPQAAYGQPPRDNIIKQLMGGMQDGMDRIFGGPATQARLDAQGGASPRARLAEVLAPKPPQPTAYSSLPAGGGVPAASTGPQVGGGAPQVQPQGTQTAPAAQMREPATADAAAAPGPVQVAQASQGGGTNEADRLLAIMQDPRFQFMSKQQQEIVSKRYQDAYSAANTRESVRDGRHIFTKPDGTPTVLYNTNDDGTKHGTFQGRDGNTYAWDPTDPAKAPTRLGPSASIRIWNEPGPDGKMVAAPAGSPKGAAGYYEADGTPRLMSGSGVNVTTNVNKGETKEAETLGAERGKAASEVEAAGRNAPGQIARLNLLGNLLDKADTGKLGPAEATAVGWAQALGLDPKQLGLNPNQAITAEASQKIINELTTASIGKGGFPANNFSDADREFLQKIFPNLANRPESNKIALDVMRRIQQRNMEVTDAWGDYQDRQEAQGKTSEFSKFEREFRRSVRGQPDLFADVRDQIDALPSSGNKRPPPGDTSSGNTSGSGTAGGGDRTQVMKPGQSTTIGGIQIRRVN